MEMEEEEEERGREVGVILCECVCVCDAPRAASGLCDDLLLLLFLSPLCGFYPVNMGCECGATPCLVTRKYQKNNKKKPQKHSSSRATGRDETLKQARQLGLPCGRPVRAAARPDHCRGRWGGCGIERRRG